MRKGPKALKAPEASKPVKRAKKRPGITFRTRPESIHPPGKRPRMSAASGRNVDRFRQNMSIVMDRLWASQLVARRHFQSTTEQFHAGWHRKVTTAIRDSALSKAEMLESILDGISWNVQEAFGSTDWTKFGQTLNDVEDTEGARYQGLYLGMLGGTELPRLYIGSTMVTVRSRVSQHLGFIRKKDPRQHVIREALLYAKPPIFRTLGLYHDRAPPIVVAMAEHMLICYANTFLQAGSHNADQNGPLLQCSVSCIAISTRCS